LLIDTTERFEQNIDASIQYVDESDWSDPIDPVDMSASMVYVGTPSLKIKQDPDPALQARNLLHGASTCHLSYKYGSKIPQLEKLCLTYLLCKHFGVNVPTFPHVNYFTDDEAVTEDSLKDLIAGFNSITAGVEHGLF
jgi:hypothetical protein